MGELTVGVAQIRAVRLLECTGRIGDGWLVMRTASPDFIANGWSVIRDSARRGGRDPDALSLEVRINVGESSAEKLSDRASPLLALRPTHLCIDPQDFTDHASTSLGRSPPGIAVLEPLMKW